LAGAIDPAAARPRLEGDCLTSIPCLPLAARPIKAWRKPFARRDFLVRHTVSRLAAQQARHITSAREVLGPNAAIGLNRAAAILEHLRPTREFEPPTGQAARAGAEPEIFIGIGNSQQEQCDEDQRSQRLPGEDDRSEQGGKEGSRQN
jgi:hypothetical protein